MTNKYKFPDTFFLNLKLYLQNYDININWLYEMLRECDKVIEKEKPVPYSKKAKQKYQKAFHEKKNKRPKGLWLEHIIPVHLRVAKIIDMWLHDGIRNRHDLEKYIEDSFYAVYKIRTVESEEAFEALTLLPEQFRIEEKENFEDYITKG